MVNHPDKRSCCSLPSWIITWGPWSSWKAITSPLFTAFSPVEKIQKKLPFLHWSWFSRKSPFLETRLLKWLFISSHSWWTQFFTLGCIFKNAHLKIAHWELRTNCLANWCMGVVHQQPLGKSKTASSSKFSPKSQAYLGRGQKNMPPNRLNRSWIFTPWGILPQKKRLFGLWPLNPEIHAAPRLPDVLTALRRPMLRKKKFPRETTGPSTQKYLLWNTFFGLKRNVKKKCSKSSKWKKCIFDLQLNLPDMISRSAAGWRSFSVGITRAWPWCALLRPGRTVPRRSGAPGWLTRWVVKGAAS